MIRNKNVIFNEPNIIARKILKAKYYKALSPACTRIRAMKLKILPLDIRSLRLNQGHPGIWL